MKCLYFRNCNMKKDEIWQSKLLLKYSQINHGTASRFFGRLSIEKGFTQEVLSNRNLLAEHAGFDLSSITMVKQTHSNHVHIVSPADVGNAVLSERDGLPDGDAMITNIKNATLVIKTNDCVPIIFYDSSKQIIGAAHAGWKGVASNIAKNTIDAMVSGYSSNTKDIFAVIGPSIRGCHYDITHCTDGRIELFKSIFQNDGNVIVQIEREIFIDLANGIVRQLTECGLEKTNFDICPDCTYEMHHRWPSRRANGNKPTGFSTWTFISLT